MINEVVVHITIDNEMDVVMAHRRAVQIGELVGLPASDQTRFATAISEVARNSIEQARRGRITYSIEEQKSSFFLFADISNQGVLVAGRTTRGQAGASAIAKDKNQAIENSRKLVDIFETHTAEKSTTFRLGKKIPEKHPLISIKTVRNWAESFAKEVPESPYEEIKKRNLELIALSDQLKKKKREADLQLEEIKRLNQLLETKNENLKQIAYTIAHDLKNPLNNIKSCSDASKNVDTIESKDKFLQLAGRSADRALEIINGLQSKIEYDPDIAVEGDQVTLAEVVDNIKEQFDPYLNEISGKIIHQLEEPVICYPSVYIYSILGNLISNSVKYNSQARPLEVIIRSRKEEEFLLLSVNDNGIGIDMKKNKEKIFKAFNRFTDMAEGKGMGLSIVHYMITRNGGKIEVDSQPNLGTTFTCYLKEYT